MTNPLEPSPSPPVDRAAAAAKVKGPATLLIVSGVIGGLLGIYSLFTGGFTEQILAFYGWMGIPEAQISEMRSTFEASKGLNAVSAVVGLAFSAIIVMGGLRLRELRSPGLALTSAILSVMCCGFCCVGFPGGIWALMVMNKPDVKAAMHQNPAS